MGDRRIRLGVAGACAAALAAAWPGHGATPALSSDRFERSVRPVLLAECVSCHGPARAEAGLRLDRAPGAGWGDRIARAVRGEGKVRMPPTGRLTAERVDAVSAWAAAGAPWPSVEAKSKGPLWSLRPVRRAVPPRTGDAAWDANPIDAFVRTAQRTAGLAPAPEADRHTLIRRATWELTGLLPTRAEVDTFLADKKPGAFERVVDRLLASPSYAERQARHWLDLVRYADTKGYIYTGEARYPFAWTYRDWVVDAIARDVPYDRFLSLQIAADRLPRVDDRDLAALGFFTVGRRFVNNVPDVIDDRIDVLARTTMGLTVACARCHDHKFDPIPTTDYYALYQVLVSSTERFVPLGGPAPAAGSEHAIELAKRTAALGDAFQAARREARDRMRRQADKYLAAVPHVAELPGNDFYVILADDDVNPALVRHWKEWLDHHARPDHPVFGPWSAYAALPHGDFAARAKGVVARPTWSEAVRTRFATPPQSMDDVAARYGAWFAAVDATVREREKAGVAGPLAEAGDEAVRQVLTGPDSPTIVPDVSIDDVEFLFNHSTRERLQGLRGKVDQWLCDSPATPPHALSLVELPKPRPQHVYRRGDPRLLGPAVEPHFPVAVGPAAGQPLGGGAGRLALARRIADPANPLTARVAVNRLWMHHFGAGLVRTPSDFGTRGEAPTHPELLDWLASEFVRRGWSPKAMHRMIVLSRTWRQGPAQSGRSRALDPDNRWLARRDPARMDLESLRDCALQVAGDLDTTRGGRSVRLFDGKDAGRRSLYGYLDRQKVDTPYRIFDFANPDQHTPRRLETTVPQQALWLLNGPFAAKRAQSLARRATAEGMDPGHVVRRLYSAVFQRDPTPAEERLSTGFLRAESGLPAAAGDQLGPVERLAQTLLLSNGFLHVD